MSLDQLPLSKSLLPEAERDTPLPGVTQITFTPAATEWDRAASLRSAMPPAEQDASLHGSSKGSAPVVAAFVVPGSAPVATQPASLERGDASGTLGDPAFQSMLNGAPEKTTPEEAQSLSPRVGPLAELPQEEPPVSAVTQAGIGPQKEPEFFQYMTQDMRENHGKYDNLYTAMYEDWLAGRPFQSGGAVTGGADEYGADVRMSAPPFNGNQNEFQIDINPTDSRFAIGTSNSGRAPGVGIFRTSDGGQTWISSDPPGVSGCCDPAIAYGSDGVAYLGILGGGGQITMKTLDNGATWERLATPSLEDRNNIAVDPRDSNTLYVTYSELGGANSQRIKGYKSTDGGRTWGSNFFIGGPRPELGYQQSSMPRVAHDGTVYVGYQQYVNSSQGCNAGTQNALAKSTDGGQTWTHTVFDIRQGGACTPGQVGRGIFCINSGGASFRSRSHPIIAVHPSDSQIVYMVYSGGDLDTPYTCAGATGFHSDTLFRKSVDGGKTFSDPIRINTDAPGSDQYYPWIDVSPNGRIWVGWNDRRNDPQNFRSRWYQAYSTDEGNSWIEEMVADVDTQPSTFIGDYHGLAAEDDRVLGMWYDSRTNASGDPYTDPNFQFGLGVLDSTPARDSIVTTQLTAFVVNLSHPYVPATVDASDLSVNQVPADTVEQTSATSLTFRFAKSPITVEGPQTMSMPAGALERDGDNDPLLPFNIGFRYDAIRLGVKATDPAADSGVELPFTNLRVAFNEPYDPATVGINDLTLTQGRVTAATPVDKLTIDYTLTGITVEGAVTARMTAGALTDLFGNPSVPYEGTYFTDIGAVAFPTPVRSKGPAGSLVHETTATGLLAPAGDSDGFVLRVDPRQLLSVVVTPTTPTGLRPVVDLYALPKKGAVLLGSATAAAAGQPAVLHSVATADALAGDPPGALDYLVLVNGADKSTGGYRVQLTLNAGLEDEAFGGPANNSLKTAQDLTPSIAALLPGRKDPARGAVLGRTDAAGAYDYFGFALASGVSTTVTLTGLGSPNVNVELLDPAGKVVATGRRGAANVTEIISKFTGDAGQYFARVRGGTAGVDYNLMLTRGADFDSEGNNTFAVAQNLTGVGRVLGRVGGTPATGSTPGGPVSLPVVINDGTNFRWDIQRDGSILDGTNDAYDGGVFHRPFTGAATGQYEDNNREVVLGPQTIGNVAVTRKVFVPADQGYTRFLEIVRNTSATTVNYTISIETNLGSDGSTNLVGTSSGDLVFAPNDDWIVTDDVDAGGDPTMLHVTASPSGRVRPTIATLSGDNLRYTYNLTLNPGETQVVMHFASQNQNRATALAKATQLTELQLGALIGMTDEEQQAIVNFNLGDPVEFYAVEAGEGALLQFQTFTPADQDGEFDNRLDPMIRIYDAAFQLVAQDDNSSKDGRNALLTYEVPQGAGGTYYVEVVPSDQTKAATQGEYVLEVQGAASAPAPGGSGLTPLPLADTASVRAVVLTLARAAAASPETASSVPVERKDLAVGAIVLVDYLFAQSNTEEPWNQLVRRRWHRDEDAAGFTL